MSGSAKYDLVFGLGSACSCSETLRAAGLQLASFPLDWVSGSDLLARTALLTDDFAGFLNQGDFERVENADAFGHDTYRNGRTGLVHPHDFPQGAPLESSFAEVKAKYDRRIARLLSLLDRAHDVLVVWIGDPRDERRVSDADMRTCLDRLRKRWPSVRFELRVIECVPGVSSASPQIRAGEGFSYAGFDYHRTAPGAKPWEVVPELLVPRFADSAVADYRTDEERRAHRRRLRERVLKRFGAKSTLDLLLTKFEYRLFKHLQKCLRRRGCRVDLI